MPFLAKIAMLSVVFIDIMGQGLLFPIVDTLVMDPKTAFLPAGTTEGARQFSYGLVIGTFFLAWFLGAPYISRLSDTVGRKPAILVCLLGAFAGYALTLAALYADSLVLLLIGRAVTGFTAGNQPIAQAAMIDGSADEADRGRNMGYIITATSAGLLGGPLIGGLASDPAILGRFASLELPFYIALVLVALSGLLVITAYQDVRRERGRFEFHALEIILVLVRIRHYPLVIRASIVLLFFHITNLTFYIFISNYMENRFGYGTFGTSMVMFTIGASLAFSSAFLVVPAQKHLDKKTIMAITFAIWFCCALGMVTSPFALLCFVYVFCFYFVFGIAYPTMMSIFSMTVGDDEQGWVMGITLAVFTLVGGVMSLIGGWLDSIDIAMPFYIIMGAAVVAVVVMQIVWRHASMERLMRKVGG